MLGTIINSAAILIGAILGRMLSNQPKRSTEAYFRAAFAAFIVFYGMRLTWISINGPVLSILGQVLITILALSIGKLIGHLIGLQKLSNKLGGFARERMAAVATADAKQKFNDGFLTCTALFCAAPLSIPGAVADGLSNYFYPLLMKGIVEGFAAFGIARMFGWGVALSFVPVLAFQGSISLLSITIRPWMEARELIDPCNAVAGFLIFSVSLIILEIKKVPLADYLPALLVAPLMARVIKAF